MARGGEWAAAAAVALWWMVAGTEAVWLEIRPSATKCVSEDIQSNVVVIGDYSLLYEHHHGVELELVKLEASVQAIHENLLLLKTKELNMSNVSDKTNSRIAWLSLLSLSVCIIVSGLQLWHLQQYFRKMKVV